MAGVFHVEFGINETPLTQLLNKQDFVQAEKLIRENTHQSYLNEGIYRTIIIIIIRYIPYYYQIIRFKNLKLMLMTDANAIIDLLDLCIT